jgi:phage baseplate assembly protein W
MATYSFKSSGKTREQANLESVFRSTIPVGIKTPLKIGGETGIFEMHTKMSEQMADNLRNLLLTNWGERLGLYNFGANLRPLTTEYVNQDDFDQQAIDRIREAVNKWMPYIDLVDFMSEIDRTENKNTGVIKIKVSYNIPVLQVTNKAIQVVLYVV